MECLEVKLSKKTSNDLLNISRNKNFQIKTLFETAISLLALLYDPYNKEISLYRTLIDENEKLNILYKQIKIDERISINKLIDSIEQEKENIISKLIPLKFSVILSKYCFILIDKPLNIDRKLTYKIEKKLQSLKLLDISKELVFCSIKYDENKYKLYFYNNDIKANDQFKWLIKHFKASINTIIYFGHANTEEIILCSNREYDLIRNQFNITSENDYRQSVVQIFEEQVAKTPFNIAIIDGSKELVYNELNIMANKLVYKLLELKIKPGDFIGIQVTKKHEIIAAIIAILKVGAIYVPFECTYPKERLTYIFLTTSLKACIVYDSFLDISCPLLDISKQDSWSDFSDNLKSYSNPESIVYCMFTSGSSGVPKGSLIKDSGIVRLVKNSNYVKLSEKTIMAQVSTMAFDASTFEIWGALLNGGQLVIYNSDITTEAIKFKEKIVKDKINTMFLTTALFNQLVIINPKMFDSIKNLLIGGEKISADHVKMFKYSNKKTYLIHVYGPTENTTFTTFYKIPNIFNNLPIGKPINNTQVYIMNNNYLCGINMIGEICITGLGIAYGYLDDKLTNDKSFLRNPFGQGQIYYSGDIARWLPDGNIDFIGRKDDRQIKINGFRIELDDIQKTLRSFPMIRDCFVISSDTTSTREKKYIIAYLVSNEKLDIYSIKSMLIDKLPQYMIPNFILQIDYIPLNANGKVDKNALLKMKKHFSFSKIGPKTKVEKRVCQIIKEILNVENIGLNNSFRELGGDSLNAIEVAYRLAQNNFEVSVMTILTSKNLNELCNDIKPGLSHSEKIPKLNIIFRENIDQLSIAIEVKCKRKVATSSYMIQSFKNSKNFFVSTIHKIPSKEIFLIEKIVSKIIYDQEVLRTAYSENEKTFILHEYNSNWHLQCIEISDNIPDEILKELDKYFLDKRNFSNDELLAIIIIVKIKESYYIYLNAHHVIWDGVSNILFKEMINLYHVQPECTFYNQGKYHNIFNNCWLEKNINDILQDKILDKYQQNFNYDVLVKSCCMARVTIKLSKNEILAFNTNSSKILIQCFIESMLISKGKNEEIMYFEIENGRNEKNYFTLGMFASITLKVYNIKTNTIHCICNEFDFSRSNHIFNEIISKHSGKSVLINNVSNIEIEPNIVEGFFQLSENNISLVTVSCIHNNMLSLYLPCKTRVKETIHQSIKDIVSLETKRNNIKQSAILI